MLGALTLSALVGTWKCVNPYENSPRQWTEYAFYANKKGAFRSFPHGWGNRTFAFRMSGYDQIVEHFIGGTPLVGANGAPTDLEDYVQPAQGRLLITPSAFWSDNTYWAAIPDPITYICMRPKNRRAAPGSRRASASAGAVRLAALVGTWTCVDLYGRDPSASAEYTFYADKTGTFKALHSRDTSRTFSYRADGYDQIVEQFMRGAPSLTMYPTPAGIQDQVELAEGRLLITPGQFFWKHTTLRAASLKPRAYICTRKPRRQR